MKWFSYCFVLLVCATALSQSRTTEQSRFYKAECGTAADYLELAKDGTFRIVGREHTGIWIKQRGRWVQNGSVITFKPESVLQSGETKVSETRTYEGTEVKYGNKVFITFDKEDSAEIVISLDDIKRDLDRDPSSLPMYVLFKTSADVFNRETKQTYPFRYIKPDTKLK